MSCVARALELRSNIFFDNYTFSGGLTPCQLIILESAIPCETQAAKWPEPLRERYFKIAEQCDKETMLQAQYTPDCMKKRNRYMVDQADVLLAVWDGTSSGTSSTVRYAKTQGKAVWILDPNSLEVNYVG